MNPGDRVTGKFGRFPMTRSAVVIAASDGELVVETLDGVRHSVRAVSVKPMDEGKAARRVSAILKVGGSRVGEARARERVMPVEDLVGVPSWPNPDEDGWQ